MRQATLAALGLVVATLVGCGGTATNTAPVFTPQRDTIELKVQTADTSVSSVEFQVDDKVVGTDDNGADGWSFQFDTKSVDDGLHYIKAFGTLADGTRTQLLDNTLLIDNAGKFSGGTSGGSTGGSSDSTKGTGDDTTGASGDTTGGLDDTGETL